MKRWICIISLISMVVSHIAAAQNTGIAVTADKQKILIGEPLQLHFTITAADGSTVAPLHIDSIYHFEILQKSKTDTQLDGSLMRLKQTYTITSWDSGRWQIPSFQLASGHKTKSLIIDVGYTPFDAKQDYNDIKDILDVKRPERTTWYWYVIGAALLIALFILLFPRKKKQPGATPVSYEGAYKEALQQLEKLKKRAADEDAKRYYTTLIDIFRSYLQKRRNI